MQGKHHLQWRFFILLFILPWYNQSSWPPPTTLTPDICKNFGHHCPPVKVHHDTHKSHLRVNCGGEELPWRRIWLPPLGNLPQKNRGGRDHPHHHHHQGHHHKHQCDLHRHQCDHHRHHNRRRHHYCHHTVFVAVIVIVIIIITIINKIIWLPPNKKLPQKRWRTLCVVDGYSSSSPQ